jgi:hypothetical protein
LDFLMRFWGVFIDISPGSKRCLVLLNKRVRKEETTVENS